MDEALTNVGLFTVLDLRATMFSRGRIFVEDLKGKELENDPFLERISEPNFSQSQQDFLYQHEFFKGTGTNITRIIASKPNNIDKVFSLENLIPSQVNYNEANKFEKFIFAASDKEEVIHRFIKYTMHGKVHDIPLTELNFFYDVSNGLTPDSRFRSPSRIDALVPALANIYEAQKSKNINLRMAAKHIISSGPTGGEGYKDGLQTGEKNEIENNFFHKQIIASESNLNVQSLANNLSKLMFDESTSADLLKIAGAYGITKDVLNWALNGASTYENKSTAIVEWIQNSIQFEADDFANSWSSYFNYPAQGKRIRMTFDHLPVMQVLKDREIERKKKEVEAIQARINVAKELMEFGYTREQAAEVMGLKNLSYGD